MTNPKKNQPQVHQPVLLKEIISLLDPKPGQAYLDLTAGYGGHAAAILARTRSPRLATLVDRDEFATAHLKDRFKGQGISILQSDFYTASQQLVQAAKQFDIILADLGVSSPHLNTSSRGFSLKRTGPLDMRMDQSGELTADEIVNRWDQTDLSRLLNQYGEERRSHKIASAIVSARPISSTTELAGIVASAARSPKLKIHPATKTFQAVRMAVNDELHQLKSSLPLWLELLKPDGRLAVISFHSLEDRLVKQMLNDNAKGRYSATLQLLTKKPVTASKQELVINPRARSAKLRAAVKIKISSGLKAQRGQKGRRVIDANTGKRSLPGLQSSRQSNLKTR